VLFMENENHRTLLGRSSRHLPFFILTLFLAVLGLGIYLKTTKAVAPPIYDPMAYYTKGAFVWREWSEGHLVNPFNIGPTVRPPGTMLLSAPLGFSPDFRAFFFRSIFFPVVLFLLAFWLLAESRAQQRNRGWANVAGALLLASSPMLYQFERNAAFQSPYDWGYVDCFVGGLAALAASLLIVSVRRQSAVLAATGALVGAFTLLVKPVGLLLMPVFCFLWLVEFLGFNWPINVNWRNNSALRHYALVASALMVAVFGAATAASFGSEYLSRTNINVAVNGQQILINMFKDVPLWELVSRQIHTSFGWHWFCVSCAATLLLTWVVASRLFRRSLRVEDLRFLAALAVLSGGLVWWVKFAGPAQIRYLYPFAMIFAVVLIPMLLDVMERALPVWLRRVIAMACVAPAAIIVALLFSSQPPMSWQALLGVNLSAGQFREEVEMGDYLVEWALQEKRAPTIYILQGNERQGVVWSEGIYRQLIHPEVPTFTVYAPTDWIRATVVRRRELVNSDFVLFYLMRDTERLRALLAQENVLDPATESEVFAAWLTQASPAMGVETRMESTLRLLKVTDRMRLDEAFGLLIGKHKWRDVADGENNAPAILTP
jgi:hypothetical protein